ncbi:hypothetical protein HMPREF1870_01792 [Bacteroidales bacterium KA00344]|nr:hypothetical protein HMPREF1870_01792 [Bacteroidales bacterium KA00344]
MKYAESACDDGILKVVKSHQAALRLPNKNHIFAGYGQGRKELLNV